jgi:hypothetical protein
MRPLLAATLLMACAQKEPEASGALASPTDTVAEAPVPVEKELTAQKDVYALHAQEIMGWTRLYASRGRDACEEMGPWAILSKERIMCRVYFPVDDRIMVNVVAGVDLVKDKKIRQVAVAMAIESAPCEVHLLSDPTMQALIITYDATKIYVWILPTGSTIAEESRPGLAGEAEFAQQWFSQH